VQQGVERLHRYEALLLECLNLSGLEERLTRIRKAKIRKKVMVVGGGSAGMEAARVSALKGHEVQLYEKENRLGGALNMASAIPGKEKLRWIIEYYAYKLPRLGVRLKLGQVLGRREVEKQKPDVIIVATGSKPVIPEIPSVNNPNVVLAHHVTIEGNEGKKIRIPSDWVVLARGLEASNRIVQELEGYSVHLIGDCLQPRRIFNAVSEGFRTAQQIN